MTHPLTVVYTANNQMETTLIKSRLEAEGIPVQVAQEGIAAAYSFANGPLTKADILVPEEYADTARAILAEIAQSDEPNPSDAQQAEGEPEN